QRTYDEIGREAGQPSFEALSTLQAMVTPALAHQRVDAVTAGIVEHRGDRDWTREDDNDQEIPERHPGSPGNRGPLVPPQEAASAPQEEVANSSQVPPAPLDAEGGDGQRREHGDRRGARHHPDPERHNYAGKVDELPLQFGRLTQPIPWSGSGGHGARVATRTERIESADRVRGRPAANPSPALRT